MEIHEKTLVRLLNNENKAGYITLYKIYRVLTDAPNDTELLNLVPESIKQHLIKYNPKKTNDGIVFSSTIESEIARDSVFMEIFFMAGAGEITRREVSSRFGSNGLETVEKMIRLGVLKELTPEKYIIGNQQANLSPALLKKAGLHLSEKHLKADQAEVRGNNFVGLFAEGLSEDTYQEWLRIDEEAYDKKVALASRPGAKGSKRAFTFMATDLFVVKLVKMVGEE